MRPGSAPVAFLALCRALLRCSGQAAFQRAAPLYLGLVIIAVILFGGNGMDAKDVTRLATARAPFRLGLFLGWLIPTLPAVRALLGTPATFYLRTLPAPRAWSLGILGALLLCAETPWLVLWTWGNGCWAGTAAMLLAAAIHALLVAQLLRPADWAAALVSVGAVAAWPTLPGWMLAAVSAWPLWHGLRQAYRRAPEGRPPVQGIEIRGPAPLALALVYGISLLRGSGAQIGRALGLCGAAGTVTWLAARNNHVVPAEAVCTLALIVGAPALLLGAAGLCGPVLRVERGARWLLQCCGTGGGARVAATALCVGSVGAGLGLLYGAALGPLVGTGLALRARLILDGVAAGGALGTGAGVGLRRALRWDPGDPDRVLWTLLAVVPAAAVSAWMLREAAPLMWAALALGMGLHAARAEAPLNRRGRLLRERALGTEP